MPFPGGFGDDAGPVQVLRLNPTTLAVEARILLERKAFGAVLDDVHNRLYVGNTVDLSVTVVDTAQNKAIGTVQRIPHPLRVQFSRSVVPAVVDRFETRVYKRTW